VTIVDLQGASTALSDRWSSIHGLAWSPSGDEVWFTGTPSGAARALYAVSLSRKLRLVERVPGAMILHDISRAGRVLLSRDDMRLGLLALPSGEKEPRDLSWFDYSALRGLSADATKILFDEVGEAGGASGHVYFRSTDGSPPVDLGEGVSVSLSPDSKWALALASQVQSQDVQQLQIMPTGTGSVQQSPPVQGILFQWGAWLADGKHMVLAAGPRGKATRLNVSLVNEWSPRPISPEGVSLLPYSNPVSPDGKQVIGVAADAIFHLYATDGSGTREIAGIDRGEQPVGWTGDGLGLYVYRPGEMPSRVFRLNLSTGRKELWKTLMPPDPSGIFFIRPPHFANNGNAYAYNYSRLLSDLYLVDGLKSSGL
jgi:hypothetical protein